MPEPGIEEPFLLLSKNQESIVVQAQPRHD
jgi:hypothetical protein